MTRARCAGGLPRWLGAPALLLTIVLTAGCSTASSPSPFIRDFGEPAPSSNEPFTSHPSFLSGDQVRGTSVGNLYEAVERLRPLWLTQGFRRSARVRTEIIVVLNEAYFGPSGSLRDLTPEHVRSMAYMDGSQAAARFSYPGVQPHIAGAIVVEMGYDGEAVAGDPEGDQYRWWWQ